MALGGLERGEHDQTTMDTILKELTKISKSLSELLA